MPHWNYGNVEQTYAVFTMIAVAIAGFGIMLALYTGIASTESNLAVNQYSLDGELLQPVVKMK